MSTNDTVTKSLMLIQTYSHLVSQFPIELLEFKEGALESEPHMQEYNAAITEFVLAARKLERAASFIVLGLKNGTIKR